MCTVHVPVRVAAGSNDMASSTSVVEGSSMAMATRGKAQRADAIRSVGGSKSAYAVLAASASRCRVPLAAKNGASTSLLLNAMERS
jgi:hypothetical protein